MTKKEKQKLITKRFMAAIKEVYGITMSDEGESGTIDFCINEADSNGDDFMFNYRRSYGDVLTYCMNGDVDYDRAFDLECEMQSILAKIETEVENG